MNPDDFLDFMSLASDETREGEQVFVPDDRDLLREAGRIQDMINLMELERLSRPLMDLTSAGAFAGHISKEALRPATPTGLDPFADDLLTDDPFGLTDIMGMDTVFEEAWEENLAYDEALNSDMGISTDPTLGLFDTGEYDLPFYHGEASDLNTSPRYDNAVGFEDSTIAGLADALGPDFSSVSRLGGPFAGYGPDELTSRLRSLVKQA